MFRVLIRVLVRVACLGTVVALLGVLVGGAGVAQAASPSPPSIAPMPSVDDLPTVVGNATRWLIGILAVLATFFLTLGGARYLAAGGDPSEVERAKGSLRNAAIGYALAVLAPVLLKVLQTILGVK